MGLNLAKQLKWLAAAGLLFLSFGQHLPAQKPELLPQPKNLTWESGKYRLDSSFTVALRRIQATRMEAAVGRFLKRLDLRTGLRFSKTPTDIRFPMQGLNVAAGRRSPLELKATESYSLEIQEKKILLNSETDLGALHGLETLLQLLEVDSTGYYFPACRIEDAPRFPWRGLMIDASRHFISVGALRRNLDAMAAMKMNVLHLHLSDDQGFRIESKLHPYLHQMGSNGEFYTQEEIKLLVAYADARGIRLVPELDIPGHTTSWFVGHPELASAPGPYILEQGYGPKLPVIDPSKESTYAFLESIIGEVANLFPDAYFHIGGDEANPTQWENSLDILAFMEKNKLKDFHALQQHFLKRINSILDENGKRMVAWDDALDEDLSPNTLIQSWGKRATYFDAARSGHDVVLSNGFSLNLCRSAAFHYLNDPAPADADLNDKAMTHVLGGEATMWSELVTSETIDSRIWPRTCAIAERLWSPRENRDVKNLYERLDKAEIWLEEVGSLHRLNQSKMAQRICQGHDPQALEVLLEVAEPLKMYGRHGQGIDYTTQLPMGRLADIAFPEAKAAREFQQLMNDYLEAPDFLSRLVLEGWLEIWRDNHVRFEALAHDVPMLRDALPLSKALSDLSIVALELMEMHGNGEPEYAKKAGYATIIEEAKKPGMECHLAIVPGVSALQKAVFGN